MQSTAQTCGSCLCGAVTLSTGSEIAKVGICHCSMCRKWTSGPFFTVDCKSDLTVTGAENVNLFSSSDWAERGFCSKCGTHLYYRLKPNNQYIVSAGLFDGEVRFCLDHQIFIDEKPEYYAFANETKNMTGAEVFAQFTETE